MSDRIPPEQGLELQALRPNTASPDGSHHNTDELHAEGDLVVLGGDNSIIENDGTADDSSSSNTSGVGDRQPIGDRETPEDQRFDNYWPTDDAGEPDVLVANASQEDLIEHQTVDNSNSGGQTFDDIGDVSDTRAHSLSSVQLTDGIVGDAISEEAAASDIENQDTPQETAQQIEPVKKPWHPTWLRLEVLAVFAGLFLISTIALSLMLSYSEYDEGIWETQLGFARIWKFGPTAVVTIMSAFWGRVELQAMIHMPWIAISSNNQAMQDVYALDYTSMLSPLVLTRSIRRKHHLVYLATIVSITLKALTALAPGLFSLSSVQTNQATKITVLDSFNISKSGDNEILYDQETRPYYAALAVHDYQMPYPFGVNKDTAYQTFEVKNSDHGSPRGTSSTPLRGVFRSLYTDLHCLQLDRNSGINITADHYYLRFEGCDKTIRLEASAVRGNSLTREEEPSFWRLLDDLPPEQACGTLPQESPQFIYYAALFREPYMTGTTPDLLAAGAIICTPVAWLADVEVTDNGIDPDVTLLPDQNITPVAADTWVLLGNSIPSYTNFLYKGSGGTEVWGPVAVDWQRDNITNSLDPSIFDSEVLLNSTVNLFRNVSPFIGHYIMRHTLAQETTGQLIFTSMKLKVSRWAGISMTLLFAMVGILSLILLALLKRKGRDVSRTQNTTTLFGQIIFLHGHTKFAGQVRHFATDNLESKWNDCTFSPMVLRTWVRALLTTILVAAIVSLSITQKLSDANGGLADLAMNQENHANLLWKSIPALFMLGISLYANSCNTAFRALGNLWCLSVRQRNVTELDISLQDTIGLRAFYRSVHLGAYTIAVSQVLALACMLLTTLASVLFDPAELGHRSDIVQRQQETSLGSRSTEIDWEQFVSTRNAFKGLLLPNTKANMTFPRNTYRDLLFPDIGAVEDSDALSIISAEITVPAAKLQFTCKKLSENDYRVTRPDEGILLIYQPSNCPNRTMIDQDRYPFPFGMSMSILNSSHPTYFGDHFPSPRDMWTLNKACGLVNDDNSREHSSSRSRTYFWGAYSGANDSLISLSAWECNYTWYEVTTHAHLAVVDGIWIVNPAKPPKVFNSTAKPWEPPFDIPLAYYNNESDADPGLISAFPTAFLPIDQNLTIAVIGVRDQFVALIKPFGDLPLEALTDPKKEASILRGLQDNLAYITAQLANVESRLAIEGNSTDAPSTLPETEVAITYESPRRLIQNATATYCIISILAGLALFNMWRLLSYLGRRLWRLREHGLLAMDVTGLAPDGFGSFEGIVGLLGRSNVYAHLPPDVESTSKEELRGRLHNLKFRLGWFRNTQNKSHDKIFTVGVLDDDDFEFLGGKGELQRRQNESDAG